MVAGGYYIAWLSRTVVASFCRQSRLMSAYGTPPLQLGFFYFYSRSKAQSSDPRDQLWRRWWRPRTGPVPSRRLLHRYLLT